jgi:hypothetical protein
MEMYDINILIIAFTILGFCLNAAGILWVKTSAFETEYAKKNQKVLNALNKELNYKLESIVDLK